MAILHLRNVPEELDAALAADARRHRTSKNQRAIVAMRRGLRLDQVERSRLVAEIRRDRPVPRRQVDVAEEIRSGRRDRD